MAEKIYVLDAHTRYDAPSRIEESRVSVDSVRKEARARKSAPARPSSSSQSDDSRQRAAAEGPRVERSTHGHVPQIDDEVSESWIKSQDAGARRPFHPQRALLGLYTLGGMAPLALRVGPRQFLWAALWIVALTAWVTLGWFREPVRAMMTGARLPILPFLAGLVLVHAMGSLAWSRAVLRTVRDERFQPERMPRLLRTSWVAGALGMMVPGLGLAIAGRARRAALALWIGTQVVFASVVLAHAGLVWTWNTKSGADALPKTFVEGLFIACALVVTAGALLWIASALEGARVHQRSNGPRLSRLLAPGDAVAVALVLSLVAAATVIRPARVAQDLDAYAGWLRASGAQLIPLGLESAAAAFDAGRPEYAMRVAELYTEMGHEEKAQAIQDRLRERWEAYAQMLLQETATSRTLMPARPIQPQGDLVPKTPDLVPSLAGQAVASSTAAQ
jgi:hypothetical protein